MFQLKSEMRSVCLLSLLLFNVMLEFPANFRRYANKIIAMHTGKKNKIIFLIMKKIVHLENLQSLLIWRLFLADLLSSPPPLVLKTFITHIL